MKVAIVNTVAGILSGIKLNKITDKDVKNKLLRTFIEVRKVIKDADTERLEIIDKFQKDWLEELKAVENFRTKNVPVIGHEEYLEAERDANTLIASIFDREVEINLNPVSLDDFMSFCGNEDITFEQVAFLQECGVIV